MNRREAMQNAIAAVIPAGVTADVKTATADETPLMIVITTGRVFDDQLRRQIQETMRRTVAGGPLEGVPVMLVDQSTTVEIVGKPSHSATLEVRMANVEAMLAELHQDHKEEKERQADTRRRMMAFYDKGIRLE